MPKRKQPNQNLIQSLDELTSSYERAQLSSALQYLKHDLSWKIFRAALIKEYQDQVIYTIDNCGKSGKQIEAARHSGIAEALLDTATSLIDKYIAILENKSQVIENVRPTE